MSSGEIVGKNAGNTNPGHKNTDTNPNRNKKIEEPTATEAQTHINSNTTTTTTTSTTSTTTTSTTEPTEPNQSSKFVEHTWSEISANNNVESSVWPPHLTKPAFEPVPTFSQLAAKSIAIESRRKSSTPNTAKRRASSAPAVRVTPASFLFGQQLGEGAYGRVVHAKRKDTNEEFAVKVMEKNFIKREKKVAFVMQEKNILSRLTHRNIVKLYFTFKDADNLYMVMDLCYGELLHYINHRSAMREEEGINGGAQENSALSLKETQFYIAEITEGLEYLHTHHIVHRDLKPENILLDYVGHVKIADFGTALDETKDEAKGGGNTEFCGTAQYVSPEVLEDRPANKGCDLWALGCIVYQVSCFDILFGFVWYCLVLFGFVWCGLCWGAEMCTRILIQMFVLFCFSA
jgi:hypothetical protein